ncbi:MAG: ComEC family competence protein, partial [Bacteroidales bacterium]|nr:ComEC family competence protein [Bacteroidales bacterium]
MQISPLIKLAVCFIIGIGIAQVVPFVLVSAPTLLGIGAWLVMLALLIKQDYRSRVYQFGLPACIFMALLGFLRTKQIDERPDTSHFSKQHYSQLWVKVADSPNVREKSVRATLHVLAGEDSAQSSPCTGQVMAYFAIDSLSTQLRYGDVLKIKNRCQSTEHIGLLGDFDYRQYLARKQIFHTAYLSPNTWQKVDSNAGNPIRTYAIRLRSQLLSILSQQGIKGAEYAVASAILLGYSDELTPDLRQTYQSSGTMHILCVSGLHVGLFAMVIMQLLFFLHRKRWKLMLKAGLVLICIWSYVLITGFSPSVLRAAV